MLEYSPCNRQVFCRILFLFMSSLFSGHALMAASVPASVALEACESSENEPVNLVHTHETLQFPQPAQTPIGPIGQLSRVGYGVWVEVAALGLLGLLVVVLLKRLKPGRAAQGSLQGHRSAYAVRSTSRRPLNILLQLVFVALLILVADTAVRAYLISKGLDRSIGHVNSQDYSRASESLLEVQGLRDSALIGLMTPGFRSSVERIDVGRLLESSAVRAIYSDYPDSIDEANSAIGSLRPVSDVGVRVKGGLYSWLSQAWLEQGDSERALKYALEGYALDGRTRSNVCVAKYHLAAHYATNGRYSEAFSAAMSLGETACEVSDEERAVLYGFIARKQAQAYLMGEPPDTMRAVQVEEKAYQFMADLGVNIPFVTCDYAAALEPHSLALLAAGRPEAAVEAIEETAALVPQREFVDVVLPQALWHLGAKRLEERRFDESIASLERARLLPLGKDNSDILEMLVMAYMSKGSDAYENGKFNTAVDSIAKAHRLKQRDKNIAIALTDAYLGRADESMRAGDFTRATEDLATASRLAPSRRRQVKLRQQMVGSHQSRLAIFREAPDWLHAPSFTGEVVKDVNGDGVADGLIYYDGKSEQPAAVGYLSASGVLASVALLNADSEVIAALRDNNLDGELDERIDYQGGGLVKFIVDSDQDKSPDVLVNYNDEAGMVRQFLSGRFVMRFKSGMVATATDFLSSPDIFIRVFKNGEYIGRTETVVDTHFPNWQRGVVLDYTVGSIVGLEAWDEDTWTGNDLVDSYEFRNLPGSGIHKFSNNNVVVEIDVQPTDLPEGHVVWDEAPSTENVFLDNPTAIPELGHLIAKAHRARESVRFNRWVTKTLVMNLLVPRLIPFQSKVLRYLTELVIEYAVVDPLLGN